MDTFSLDLVFKLSEHTGNINYTIKLVNSQQPLYEPIYSLKLIELKILKAYIETNLANGFIRPSKLPISTLILFDRKLKEFFWLCVHYRDFNNLIIKNQYLLSLVRGLLDRLKDTRRFTQLEFISAYH